MNVTTDYTGKGLVTHIQRYVKKTINRNRFDEEDGNLLLLVGFGVTNLLSILPKSRRQLVLVKVGHKAYQQNVFIAP